MGLRWQKKPEENINVARYNDEQMSLSQIFVDCFILSAEEMM